MEIVHGIWWSVDFANEYPGDGSSCITALHHKYLESRTYYFWITFCVFYTCFILFVTLISHFISSIGLLDGTFDCCRLDPALLKQLNNLQIM